jgi:trehalose synthase
VVSEAIWKDASVVAGKAGGIPMQISEDMLEYLASGIEDCAREVLSLLRDEARRKEFGEEGRERVRGEFLTPRMIRDKLQLARGLVSS